MFDWIVDFISEWIVVIIIALLLILAFIVEKQFTGGLSRRQVEMDAEEFKYKNEKDIDMDKYFENLHYLEFKKKMSRADAEFIVNRELLRGAFSKSKPFYSNFGGTERKYSVKGNYLVVSRTELNDDETYPYVLFLEWNRWNIRDMDGDVILATKGRMWKNECNTLCPKQYIPLIEAHLDEILVGEKAKYREML